MATPLYPPPRRVLDTTCTPTGKRSREPPSWPLSPFSPPRLMGYRPFPRRSDSLQERAPFTPLISPLIQAAATYEAPPSPPSPASFRKRRHPARSILKAGWGEGGGGISKSRSLRGRFGYIRKHATATLTRVRAPISDWGEEWAGARAFLRALCTPLPPLDPNYCNQAAMCTYERFGPGSCGGHRRPSLLGRLQCAIPPPWTTRAPSQQGSLEWRPWVPGSG